VKGSGKFGAYSRGEKLSRLPYQNWTLTLALGQLLYGEILMSILGGGGWGGGR
jgi:hypothetical protein